MESQSCQDFLNSRFGAQHRLYRKVNTRLLASGGHFRCFRGYVVTISASLLIQDDQKVSVRLMITIHMSGAQRLFDHLVLTAVRSLNRVLTEESRFSSVLSCYFGRRRSQKMLRSEVIHKVGSIDVMKTLNRNIGVAPSILNLGSRWG